VERQSDGDAGFFIESSTLNNHIDMQFGRQAYKEERDRQIYSMVLLCFSSAVYRGSAA
jgi:hypothetical protein